ncbi:WPP domain [Dillenia turbinata]|uniref:WPP domain n=1 Tax=Dillenia turbinata TaxID=194707 RepID=A0AAN8ZLJ8_9MAGN
MTEENTTPATMADESNDSKPHDIQQEATKKLEKLNISFSIWPPSQRTRDAVIDRLIETLSTPSVLSKRYGPLPSDEASAAARRIEDEAFSTASSPAGADDDGIEILQAYSREISKRMLETVKAKAASSGSNAEISAPSTDTAINLFL